MNSLGEILNTLRSNKRRLFRKCQIRSLAIFGSLTTGQSDDLSDVDILVEFENSIGIEFIDFANELEKILNTQVDLVSKRGIKLRHLREIESDLQYV